MLDAEILSDVYLILTGGQTGLFDSQEDSVADGSRTSQVKNAESQGWGDLLEVKATETEIQAHEEFIAFIEDKNSEGSIWKALNNAD